MLRKKIIIYAIFPLLFFVMYFFGRFVGGYYILYSFPYLPDFLENKVLNWIIFGLVFAVLINSIENKYVWSNYYDQRRKEMPNKYNMAPMSLGACIGFLTCWVY